MTRQLKRNLVAAGVAMAFGAPLSAHATPGAFFDPDGTGGASAAVISQMDWQPGHVLYSDCFGAGAIGVVGGCTIYAQGTIGVVNKTGGGTLPIPAGVSYTFTLQTKATVSLPAGSLYDGKTPRFGDTLIISAAADPSDIFTIYKDSSDNTNNLTGAGFTDGSVILSGSVSVKTFTLSNQSIAPQLFDQAGGDGDQYGGLQTLSFGGAPNFNVEVTGIDSNYFKDPLSSFLVQLNDISQADVTSTPFSSVGLNPAQKVDGVPFTHLKVLGGTNAGLDGIVDVYCGKLGGGTCGAEGAGDASTTFNTTTTPEPGVLALLSVGLAGLGVFSRRARKGAKAA